MRPSATTGHAEAQSHITPLDSHTNQELAVRGLDMRGLHGRREHADMPGMGALDADMPMQASPHHQSGSTRLFPFLVMEGSVGGISSKQRMGTACCRPHRILSPTPPP